MIRLISNFQVFSYWLNATNWLDLTKVGFKCLHPTKESFTTHIWQYVCNQSTVWPQPNQNLIMQLVPRTDPITISWESDNDPITHSWNILVTDRQTDRQSDRQTLRHTDTTKHIITLPFEAGDKYIICWPNRFDIFFLTRNILFLLEPNNLVSKFYTISINILINGYLLLLSLVHMII